MRKQISLVPFQASSSSISSVMVWGKGDYGELGVGKNIGLTFYPISIPYQDKIVKIACGSLHTIALTNHGRLLQWGSYTRMENKKIVTGKLYTPTPLHQADDLIFT